MEQVDSTKDIQTAIDAAIKKGPGSLVQLKKGRYRISAEDLQPCLTIENANDLVIQGQGKDTELIVTNPRASAFCLMNSQKVFIKSLVIDYDPLPYTQGMVIDVDDANQGCFDLEIEDGFPELDEPWFAVADQKYGMIFDANTPVIKTHVPDHIFIESWRKIADRVYRLKSAASYSSKVSYIAKGDRFVQLARVGKGGGCINITQCQGCGLTDIEINASNAGAVQAWASHELVFKRLEVKRRSNTGRLLSTNADGIHCQQSRVGPLIEDCWFEYIGDDTLNIYCTVNRILEVIKPDELILSQHCFIKLGDRLQIYDPRQGRVVAERTVKCLAELPEQRYRVQLDKAVEGIRLGADVNQADSTNISQFGNPIEIRSGESREKFLQADTVFNLSASGEGYVIRNNRMTGQRRYGILARSGKGLIDGNFINEVHGWGIVLANEADWPEGPLPYDVIIKNNTIVHSGDSVDGVHREDGGSIVIVNLCAGWNLGKGRDIRRIVIEGNKIIDPVTAAIFVGGAKDVQILNNEITASTSVPLYEKRGAVRIANSDEVKIDGLDVIDPRPNCIAAVEIIANMAGDVGAVAITGLKTQLHETAVEVLDNRRSGPSPQKLS